MAAAVLWENQQVMLVRGLDVGLLDDLWNFPAAMGRTGGEALDGLKEKLRGLLGTAPLLKGTEYKLRHNITYRAIQVHVYIGESTARTARDGLRWFYTKKIGQAAVSQLARKIAGRLGEADHSLS